MSDDTPGAGQGALPPREGQGLRPSVERPTTMRLTQVAGGQYVLTSQPHGLPALTQINPAGLSSVQGGVTRIISISPSRGQNSPLRPSLTNQSIVNVLKARPNPNVRLELMRNNENPLNTPHSTAAHSRSLKRPLSSTPEKKDPYSAKLQRVMNHRIVRSKLLKEKYAEHLLEAFYLEAGGNILDLYQYAKRPKSQTYLAYMKEHTIDSKEYIEESTHISIPHTTPSTPSATSVNSLPGISLNSSQQLQESNSPSSIPDALEAFALSSVKPTSVGQNQEQIVEKAKQEAYVVQRITDLQKDGLWSEKRLPKIQEMPRAKAHWDFLLEEMVWLAADFAQERKWKKAAAKKCARMVQKYFQDKALAAQRAEKAHEQHLKRIAGYCAKEIKIFWNNVEKLVEYKQNTILEEKRKKALDQQLSFIVDQTEKYSQLLAEGMNKSSADVASSNISPQSVSRPHSDDEFDPHMQSDEDDEETIEQEEAAVGTADQSAEVEALQRESQLELDDLLEDDFLRNYLLNRDSIRLSESDDSDNESEGKKSKKSDPDNAGKKLSKEKDIEKESKSESNESEEDSESEDESIEEINDSQTRNQSLKLLVDDSQKEEGEKTKTDEKDDLINDAAAIAESIQPKGNTLSSTTVSTKVPFLLKLPLREYQHIGLDWLVTMYERKLNGILADEMGLGKTIQTIALLAHLACEKENWGPHLIVVPTSVMLNWEMECKKWCPAFKILTYYGSQKERKLKRTGWTKPNTFHICITSYKLVIQDHQSFRRKKWKYLILDEAQNIKNFKSQRWQLLLNFQTERRLLLTGTPLQNNLMELWSLMHFLMPNVFQSHREFKEWFSNPVTGMIEGNSEYNDSIIKRLHKVLRPFLLRRLKSEVEKQMPKKYEHVVMCRLSKRQRFLYDDYMSRAKTRETLSSGNLLSVISVLMQLRKVCNHPNLFEVRPTTSPFQCDNIKIHIPSIVYSALQYDVFKHVNPYSMNLLLIMLEMHLGAYQCYRMRQSAKKVITLDQPTDKPSCPPCKLSMKVKLRDNQEVKQEVKKDQVVQQPTRNTIQSGMKMKVSGVQLVTQGIVKTIPLVNMSQAGGHVQVGAPINVSSVLKPADKIPASFAQLVQTSTGKHLLLTSNPNITGNMPVTSSAAGGPKLTFLSKQPISGNANTTQAITKAYVKFQLTSVATGTTTTPSNSTAPIVAKGEDGLRPVNSNFLGQLYSKQNSLDVRWKKDDRRTNIPAQDSKCDYKRRLQLMTRINERRCSALPLYGRDFQDVIKIYEPNKVNPWCGGNIYCLNALFDKNIHQTTSYLKNVLYNPERRIELLKDVCDRFIFYVPPVKANDPEVRVWHPPPSEYWARQEEKHLIRQLFSKPATPLHHIASAMVTQFPDPRLIQYDCGKLQTLDKLLRHLKTDSHRVLIFTQMTKMLDVLEAFLNFHGHIYLRLDGTTKVDQRQVLMERFNGDKRIFAFILSTRSGGVGVNLTGADTVIFYDSDWNPTMDAQAQDRCHRIGQTRDVHIYRLVSERTIEENILKKANQKRLLGDLAIEGGNFTTAYFKSSTIQDLFSIDHSLETAAQRMSEIVDSRREKEKNIVSEPSIPQIEDKSAVGALENALAACEDDQDVQAAKTAKAEAVADLAEFDENIPLDQEPEKEKEPEISKAEQEINTIIEKLSPIEKYAMKFIEQTESAWSAEQLAAAERQIEEQKREWELNQMAAMREEEERRAREIEDENDMITYTREDATNQVSLKNRNLSRSRKMMNKSKTSIKILKKKSFLQTKVPKSKRLKKVTKTLNSTKISVDDTSISSPKENNSLTGSSSSSEEDESTSDSNLSESDLTLSEIKHSNSNRVDHNSPRTRSRGTVAINLWTLDVSPILPGVKPVKHSKLNYTNREAHDRDNKKSLKKRKYFSDDEKNLSEEENSKKVTKKVKSKKNEELNVATEDDIESDATMTEQNNSDVSTDINKSVDDAQDVQNEADINKSTVEISSTLCTDKVCKVVLNDIIAEGQYVIPENADTSSDSVSSYEPNKMDVDNLETEIDCDSSSSENKNKRTTEISTCDKTNVTSENQTESFKINDEENLVNTVKITELSNEINMCDKRHVVSENETKVKDDGNLINTFEISQGSNETSACDNIVSSENEIDSSEVKDDDNTVTNETSICDRSKVSSKNESELPEFKDDGNLSTVETSQESNEICNENNISSEKKTESSEVKDDENLIETIKMTQESNEISNCEKANVFSESETDSSNVKSDEHLDSTVAVTRGSNEIDCKSNILAENESDLNKLRDNETPDETVENAKGSDKISICDKNNVFTEDQTESLKVKDDLNPINTVVTDINFENNISEPSSSEDSFLNTNGVSETCEDVKMPKEVDEIEMPKENIATNITKSKVDIEVSDLKVSKNIANFKLPESRKTYRKFSKNFNNKTLDAWVTRASTPTQATKLESKNDHSDTSVELKMNEALKESE